MERSAEELLRLLADLEGDQVERRESFYPTADFAAVAALILTEAGGSDGTPKGAAA
jgi:hypothetical protein